MNDPERTPAPASASTRTGARRSSLGLIVLWQLVDEPKHVYGMQKQLEQQGKDRVVNVRSRASLYQALERLDAARPGRGAGDGARRGLPRPGRLRHHGGRPRGRPGVAARDAAHHRRRVPRVHRGGLDPLRARARRRARAARAAGRAARRELADTEASSPRTPACRGSSCSRRSTGGRCWRPSSPGCAA